MLRAFVLLALAAAGGAQAAPPPTPKLDAAELRSAKALRAGEAATFGALPIAPGRGAQVRMKRIEIYAPDARILVPQPDGTVREVPRSDWIPLIADRSVPGAPRLALLVAPDGSAATGALQGNDGVYYDVKGTGRNGALAFTLAAADAGGDDSFVCGNAEIPLTQAASAKLPRLRTKAATGGTPSRTATVAIDTDNEMMSLRFADDTTMATTYMAELFTAMNVVYERDLDLTLLQGTTFLRVSTVPDPYTTTSGSSTIAQLDEFGEFWRTSATTTSVPRAFAAQISGKSPSANGGSGVAWLLENAIYCDEKGFTFGSGICPDGTCTAGHYSVNRVIRGTNAAGNVLLVAHELGHNFGLNHTHCSDAGSGDGEPAVGSNTIDQCFNGEAGSGCFGGTKVCPAPQTINGVPNVEGTLMSYCHLSGLSGCDSFNVFATVQRSFLMPNIADNVTDGCFMNTSLPNQAPNVTTPPSIAVTEDTTTAITTVVFTDADSGGGNVTATFSVPAASGALNATSSGGITAGGTATARTLTGPIASLTTYLSGGNLTYTPVTNSTATVVLTASINDNGNSGSGGAMSDSGTTNLTISAVNDAPTITVAPTLAINPTGTRVLSGLATLADVDVASASMTLTLAAADGTLTASSGGGVTVSGSGTATLMLNGTLANLNTYAAGANVTFNQDGSPSTTVNLTQTISDNGNTGSGGARTANGVTTLSANFVFGDGFE